MLYWNAFKTLNKLNKIWLNELNSRIAKIETLISSKNFKMN